MNTIIILPAYNVSNKISSYAELLVAHKDNVLFVDDASTDSTFITLTEYGFNVIKNKKNCGIAFSICKGLEYAIKYGYCYALLMDADGQHSPEHIDKFFEKLKTSDFVFGNRFHNISNVPSNKLNANILGASIINNIFGTKFRDIACGYKGFKITESLLEKLKQSDGYELVYDILFYALLNNKTIEFVDITPIYEYNEFLFSRKSELIALINVIERYIAKLDIFDFDFKYLKNNISNKKTFEISSQNITFHCFYLSEHDGYVIQANPLEIKDYIKNI